MFDLFTFSPKKNHVQFFSGGVRGRSFARFIILFSAIKMLMEFFKIIYTEFPDIVLFLPSPV